MVSRVATYQQSLVYWLKCSNTFPLYLIDFMCICSHYEWGRRSGNLSILSVWMLESVLYASTVPIQKPWSDLVFVPFHLPIFINRCPNIGKTRDTTQYLQCVGAEVCFWNTVRFAIATVLVEPLSGIDIGSPFFQNTQNITFALNIGFQGYILAIYFFYGLVYFCILGIYCDCKWSRFCFKRENLSLKSGK